MICAWTALALLALPGSAEAEPATPTTSWPLDEQHLNAGKVWQLSTGKGVTVAVVDSGVAASHPGLDHQLLPGSSVLGDQSNGLSDTSPDSHGTSVAAVIASSTANAGSGAPGLAKDSRILPVRVTASGAATPQNVAHGIAWAVDHGARVINVSMGSDQPDPMLRKSVEYAIAKNVIVVAAAGNLGEQGNPAQYPAAFPGVVAVTGVNSSGEFWPPSESGNWVTLAAPAADISSTDSQGSPRTVAGTSYSAAYVAATAALLLERYPELTGHQAIQRIIDTTSQHHQKPDPKFGYGVVNPLQALTDTAPLPHNTRNPLLASKAIPAEASSPMTQVLVSTVAAFAALVAAGLGLITIIRRRRRTHAPAGHPRGGPVHTHNASHRPRATATPKGRKRA
ncbi:S8 family serine peptidase [Kitasatospora sp. KL5]|uniref:S8 family serine peptidase n=1 Tax=Kitasatospora sp. KL5 TaxID=3425125 RepID=UPI003D6DE958